MKNPLPELLFLLKAPFRLSLKKSRKAYTNYINYANTIAESIPFFPPSMAHPVWVGDHAFPGFSNKFKWPYEFCADLSKPNAKLSTPQGTRNITFRFRPGPEITVVLTERFKTYRPGDFDICAAKFALNELPAFAYILDDWLNDPWNTNHTNQVMAALRTTQIIAALQPPKKVNP